MPQTQKQQTGNLGESLACDYLERKGFRIIARNVHLSHNELDIIAENDSYIIFVEVKTRSCHIPQEMVYGRPASAVSVTKQRHIISAARAYLRSHPQNTLQPRLDVIEVYLKKTVAGAPPQLLDIHHIRNAFMAR